MKSAKEKSPENPVGSATKVVLVDSIEELSAFEQPWNELIPLVSGVGPVQTYAWFHAYLTFKKEPAQKWVCAFSFHQNQLTGVLPLIYLKRIAIPLFQVQIFSPPFDFFHTLRFDAIFRPGFEHHYELIMKEMKRKLKVWPIVNVRYIPDFSISCQVAQKSNGSLMGFKRQVSSEDYIVMPAQMETFVAGLDGKFKRELNRRLRRLKEENDVHYMLNPKDLSHREAFADFVDLENSGWKGEENSSIRKRPGDWDLFNQATFKFREAGWMEWNFLKAGESAVAGHLVVNMNGVVYLWKIGYNEKYSTFSPGNQLLYSYIEKVIAEKSGVEINFMNQRSWFKDWNIQNRPLFSLILFPRDFLVSWIFMRILKFAHRKN